MILTRANNWLVILVVLCSASFYKLSALSGIHAMAELGGVALILLFIVISAVYSEQRSLPKNFTLPVILLLLSAFTSMFMAYFTREQPFGQTLLAQRALYYYLFYFLLHQMKVKPRDLEYIMVGLGLLYVVFYLLQYFLYPTILFDAYVRSNRGTVRIYLPGSDYMFIAFFLGIQYFFRTNRIRYLLLILGIFAIFILSGGRQILATVALVVILFLLFDRHIRSRWLLSFLGVSAAVAAFFIFQEIFQALFTASRSDARLGDEYIRIRAAEYYLTEFFKSPLAYITGNGMFFNTSNYGKEIAYNMEYRRFVLGDIGLIGNYALYGAFFVIGVLTICAKVLFLKFEKGYFYFKLMFMTMVLSLLIAGGFSEPDTICFVVMILYMIDVSRSQLAVETSPDKQPDTS